MALTISTMQTMLDNLFYAGPVYGSLHETTGGTDGSSEIGETGRVLLTFGEADTDPKTVTTEEVTFSPVTVETFPYYVGLWTAETDGTWLGEASIDSPVPLYVGDTAVFAANTIVVTIDSE